MEFRHDLNKLNLPSDFEIGGDHSDEISSALEQDKLADQDLGVKLKDASTDAFEKGTVDLDQPVLPTGSGITERIDKTEAFATDKTKTPDGIEIPEREITKEVPFNPELKATNQNEPSINFDQETYLEDERADTKEKLGDVRRRIEGMN